MIFLMTYEPLPDHSKLYQKNQRMVVSHDTIQSADNEESPSYSLPSQELWKMHLLKAF
jgi:hypothetical protein